MREGKKLGERERGSKENGKRKIRRKGWKVEKRAKVRVSTYGVKERLGVEQGWCAIGRIGWGAREMLERWPGTQAGAAWKLLLEISVRAIKAGVMC
eukprot:1146110-Pelagomonas_calceolata.AAC.4